MSHQIIDLCNGCTACVRICPVSAISGEKKTVHKINESACIDCGACGRVCPQGSVLNQAGGKCVRIKISMWPKPAFDKNLCSSCRICSEGCPVHCISMRVIDNDRHERPFISDPKSCVSCGFCADDCPIGAVKLNVIELNKN